MFLDVELSNEARRTFHGLMDELRQIQWMQWHEHDADGLHFHATIAERCGTQYESILQFAWRSEQKFEASFDNVTILRQTTIDDGIDRWLVHRTFEFL